MKKTISLFLILIVMFSVFAVSSFAAEEKNNSSEIIEYLDDGSYIVTTFIEENTMIRATSAKTGSKTSILYNANDEKLVTMKLTATYSYSGTSATCTSASTSYTIHNSNWKVTSATASKNGNKATGDFIAKKYFLGIAVQTINETIVMTCSNTGVLS